MKKTSLLWDADRRCWRLASTPNRKSEAQLKREAAYATRVHAEVAGPTPWALRYEVEHTVASLLSPERAAAIVSGVRQHLGSV